MSPEVSAPIPPSPPSCPQLPIPPVLHSTQGVHAGRIPESFLVRGNLTVEEFFGTYLVLTPPSLVS